MKTLTLTKSFANALRWAFKATSKDKGRPSLNCVSYQDGIISTADGFRIHLAKVNSETDRLALTEIRANFVPRLIGSLNGKQSILIAEESDSTFPDVTKVLPSAEKQVASFAINPRYLKEALDAIPVESMFSPAIIRYFGKGEAITIETENALACIMPMHIDQEKMKLRNFDSFIPTPKIEEPK